MARKAQPWFRFYVETPRDPKIRRLSPVHRWVWACVLCIARESPLPGFLLISERLPLEPADLADLAAVKESEVRKALAAMERLGLIEPDPNLGCMVVPKFTDRQYESDSSTERSRRHRSRNVDATLQRRSSNGRDAVDATGPSRARATETEPETEPEELTLGGNRPVPLAAASATKPPRRTRCTRHPNGNPTDEPCPGCARDREHDEREAQQAEAAAKDAAQRARETCPDCHGGVWLDDGTKCTHPRSRRAS